MCFSKLLLLVIVSILLLTSCSISYEENSIGRTLILPILKTQDQHSPSIAWRATIGSSTKDTYSNLHLAYFDNVIYASDRSGIVKAFNINNGKEIWSVNLTKKNKWLFYNPVLLSGGIAISNNRIYIGSEKGQLYALNSSNGSLEWKVKTEGSVLSSPVVSTGMVLVRTNNGRLQAFNEVNGTMRWNINFNYPEFSVFGQSSPVTAFNKVIIGTDTGYVISIAINTGEIIWKKRISKIVGSTEINRLSDVDATPVIIDDIVYAIACNGNLTALNLYNGNIIWDKDIGSLNDFIVDKSFVYLVDQKNQLISINRKTGKILWIQDKLINYLLTAPVLYQNKIVIGDEKGYTYWINPKNGKLITVKKINRSGFFSKPIIADKKLLIQAKDGSIYAIVN